MAAVSPRTPFTCAAPCGRNSGPRDKLSRPGDKRLPPSGSSVGGMVGWTLLEALLGGDAEKFFAEADFGLLPEDDDDPEGDVVLPDYAESRQAHRRICG